jgi:phage terminase large subunit-like protein
MRQNVQKALQDDTYRPTVIVKDFNLKQNGAAAWLRQEEVENPEMFELSEMSFRYGIGGFDAADSIDLNAAKMLCRRPDDDNIYFLSHYWIPQSKMDEIKNRHHPDDAPYDIWAARGLLTVVDGNKVNKRVFFDWFQMVRDELDIYPLRIGYDPWHIDDSLLNMFFNEFGKDVMVPVRQGVATLSQPMKDLKAEFQAHKIVYNNNPIDKWCFLNTYVKTDINGNIQPAKGNAAKYRIDGMAAALDAYVVYKDNLEEYESLM